MNRYYTPELYDFYRGRSVLVTGGAGFIGSHLVEQLVLFGAHVTVLDDLSYGMLSNLNAVKDDITFIHDTLMCDHTCSEAARGKSVIFHAAALTSVLESEQNHERYHQVNITGTQLLLDAAITQHVERFIFSSSAAVYGNQNEPCSETSPVNPQSFYGLTKLVGEVLMRYYNHTYQLATVALRYFNVYGPRQRPDSGVLAHFSWLLNHNEPITIYGDGHQLRDFVPVEQVVFANLMAGMKAPALSGQVINVANGTSRTVLEMLEELKRHYPHYTGTITFLPQRAHEIRFSYADCTKFLKELSN